MQLQWWSFRKKEPIIKLVFCAVGACLHLLAAPAVSATETRPIGDRLVLAINNIPYTQRQVEVYIAIKESLRRTPTGTAVQLVNATNWQAALQVFADDMLILQEAVRLGSFQSLEQNFDKYELIVRQRLRDDPGLQALAARLGIDQLTIARELEVVLRIAAFQRSKNRQASLSKRDADADVSNEVAAQAPAKWFNELQERAVQREYQGAETFVLIQPLAPARP